MSSSNSEKPTAANEQLIINLENQLKRLVDQLTDLEQCKDDLSADEYAQMKEETVEQINEFTGTLDRMNKGDVSLNSQFSRMRSSIRLAIANASNASEMIRKFGEHSVEELEAQLAELDRSLQLRHIAAEEHELSKVALLQQLRQLGHELSADNKLFFETRHKRLYQQMEQIEDDTERS